ncbi:hypothetical protein [Algihabitans sp.]|uniref:hypothetical protein n=1 Tax=Algihabitans sp. TaxID=2821514 RepID=UPI003BAA5840
METTPSIGRADETIEDRETEDWTAMARLSRHPDQDPTVSSLRRLHLADGRASGVAEQVATGLIFSKNIKIDVLTSAVSPTSAT